MERAVKLELHELYVGYREALRDVDRATDDDSLLKAWHEVRTLGWRLNELLPAFEDDVVH